MAPLGQQFVQAVSSGGLRERCRAGPFEGFVGSMGIKSTSHGGVKQDVAKALASGTRKICSARNAFAVVKDDGSVIILGGPGNGSDSS